MASLELVSLDRGDDGTAALDFSPRRPLGKPLTIASAPEEPLVTIGSNLDSHSRFERALGALEPGSTVHFVGPLGGFTLEGTAPSVVMLAEGMGITPFRSMLRHDAISGTGKHTTLVHLGTHHPFRSDTEAAAAEAAHPTSSEEFEFFAADVAEQRDATFMISGSPEFVRSTAAQLTAFSVPGSQIRRNRFNAYEQTTPAARPAPVGV